HRIHSAYLTQGASFSKFCPVKSVVSASSTDVKRSQLFLTKAPLDGPNFLAAQAATGSGRGPFQSVRSALGWHRQELVILMSAPVHALWNFTFVAAASVWFFFCARKLLASP